LDGIRSIFRFDGPVREAVYNLKYYQLRDIASEISALISEYLRSYPMEGDVLVPVPLHKNRLKKRGYNQSGIIAEKLGKLTGLPVIENSLIRIVDSLPQARSLNVEQRRNSVHNAFVCKDDILKNRQVILIDDVCTTGATLEACAAALKKGGVSSVWGVTFAREI
jgi:competence protein ComFC